MNPLAVPPLLCAVISFAIGAFVLSKNPRSPLHRSFTLLYITLAYLIALAYGIHYSNRSSTSFRSIRWMIVLGHISWWFKAA
jgi:uncharacterized membrane protein YfcA